MGRLRTSADQRGVFARRHTEADVEEQGVGPRRCVFEFGDDDAAHRPTILPPQGRADAQRQRSDNVTRFLSELLAGGDLDGVGMARQGRCRPRRRAHREAP